MTLMKSILLGSAAGIVAVASAQAADLPTRKAAPVEYVKICNVGGIVGWTLPGSDTCVKFSGYITAQFEGGNLETEYNWGTVDNAVTAIGNTTTLPAGLASAIGSSVLNNDTRQTQRVLIAASAAQQNTTYYRDATGWTTRANFGFDMASNTAYGPLIGHFDLNAENGQFFDNTGTSVYVNTGYLTWAGITAGKQQSFFSFTGGGDNWANFFSPDRKGFNEPELLAYTASFGGGFSATISAETPGTLAAPAAAPERRAQYHQPGRQRRPQGTSIRLPPNSRASAGPTSSALCTSSRGGARPSFQASSTTSTCSTTFTTARTLAASQPGRSSATASIARSAGRSTPA